MGLILGYLLVIVVNFFLVGIWMDKLKHEEKKNEAMEREMHLLDVQINRLAVLLREVSIFSFSLLRMSTFSSPRDLGAY